MTAFTPPAIKLHAAQTIWAQADTVLLNAPDTGTVLAHIGPHFPLTLLGDARWTPGMLWYHIQWSTPNDIHRGWVSAATVSFAAPGNVPASASIDTLAPSLATYLRATGQNVGVVIYDETRQRYYTYNGDLPFTVASSMKVPIMLALFDRFEQQNHKLTASEIDLLTTMIENSNNDSASTFYFHEIGGAQGITNFMQRIGVHGLTPNTNSWGYSMITPQAMVDLLTLLNNGSILTIQDRNLASKLLEHIQPDQRVGVGDTAPTHATVAMKGGWVTDEHDLWAVNSSGIVKVGQKTYIIAVYTQNQPSLESGQGIIRHVCSVVAALLT
jgi:beta-lactamase class A